MVLFGISEGKNELSHPFVHPGSERNAFVAELTAQCRAQHAESNDVESTRYCDCYANKIANAITYRELKVLGAEQGLLTGKADDVRAAFLDKARQASQACPSPSNRDK